MLATTILNAPLASRILKAAQSDIIDLWDVHVRVDITEIYPLYSLRKPESFVPQYAVNPCWKLAAKTSVVGKSQSDQVQFRQKIRDIRNEYKLRNK